MFRNAALLCLALLPGVSTRAAEEKAEPKPQPNPKLAAIAENSWEKVAGFAPTSGGILAYSGGTYDSVNQQFLIFGGGRRRLLGGPRSRAYGRGEAVPSLKKLAPLTVPQSYGTKLAYVTSDGGLR